MFQGHYRLYGRLLLGIDVTALLPALLVAYSMREGVGQLLPASLAGRFQPELLPLSEYLLYLAVVTPVWLVVLLMSQSYERIVDRPLTRQCRRVGIALVFLGSFLGLGAFTAQLVVSRAVFFAFLLLLAGLMIGARVVIHWGLRSRNLYDHTRVRILIVGTGAGARRVAAGLEASRKWGYHVVGFVTTDPGAEAGADVIATLQELPDLLVDSPPADEIIIAESRGRQLDRFQDLIRLCEELGIRTRLAADFLPAAESSLSVEFLGDTPFITFSNVPDHTLGFVAKRIVDFAVAAALLVLLSPLLLLVGSVVRRQSPGPALYRQERCGLYGRRFHLLKFRTMIDGAEDRLWEIRHLNEMDGPVFKMRDDPRVTRLGRYLRRYSIDELPQLWNVIKGEMSLVGPRAPLPEEVRAYSVAQRRRLSVKPGITCLWQVAGRSDIDFGQWMEMDLQYIDNWSFWLDLRIMLKTIPAVFTGRGAR